MTVRGIQGTSLAVFAAISMGLCATAGAATITVSKGDDLQAAVDAAADGDTIVVRKGLYGPIALEGRADLTIKGKGKPVIDASTASNGVFLNNCQRIEVSGLVVRDSQVSGIYGEDCDTVGVRKCRVYDSGDEGIQFETCERITIDRNTVDGSEDDGIAVSDGSGSQSNHCVITRNKISHVPDGGIDINGNDNLVANNLVKDTEVAGIYLNSGERNVIEKNRFLRIAGAGAEIRDGGNTITGNKIIAPTEHGIEIRSDDNMVSGNSVTKAGQSGVLVRGESNEVTKNKIARSVGPDLQDTSGGDTNTFTGNKAKTLDPPELPNPKK